MGETGEGPTVGRRVIQVGFGSPEPQSPITGRRRVEFSDNKDIKVGDPLPLEYQSVLDELDQSVPEEFRDQAQRAGYYFWSLESGKSLLDQHGNPLGENVARLADQVARSRFVWYHQNPWQGANLREVLPVWVYTRLEKVVQMTTLSKHTLDQVAKWHKGYTEAHGKPFYAQGAQEYFHYKNGVPPQKPQSFARSSNFKIYIEEGLRNYPVLEKAFEWLRWRGIHPHATKLYDQDRFVLYWDTQPTEELVKGITQILWDRFSIYFRGPAQDPFHIVLTPGGRYEVEMRFSNDDSLGGSYDTTHWQEKQYNPRRFFQQYLKLVYQGAKRPDEPYLISFVPIITRDMPPSAARTKLIEELSKKVRESDGLPVDVSSRLSPFRNS